MTLHYPVAAATGGPEGIALSIAVLGVIGLTIAVARLASAVRRIEAALAKTSPEAPVAEASGSPATAISTLPSVSQAPVRTADVSDEEFAVVAAAVATLLGSRARIVRVAGLSESTHHAAWSMEGRRSIYQSHNVRR